MPDPNMFQKRIQNSAPMFDLPSCLSFGTFKDRNYRKLGTEEGVEWTFIVLRNPLLPAGYEPAKLGPNGKHANH
jgi:hypothetical protein